MSKLLKKVFIFALSLCLVLGLSGILVACTEEKPEEPPTHTVHVDENNDGKCDECGEAMPSNGGTEDGDDCACEECDDDCDCTDCDGTDCDCHENGGTEGGDDCACEECDDDCDCTDCDGTDCDCHEEGGTEGGCECPDCDAADCDCEGDCEDGECDCDGCAGGVVTPELTFTEEYIGVWTMQQGSVTMVLTITENSATLTANGEPVDMEVTTNVYEDMGETHCDVTVTMDDITYDVYVVAGGTVLTVSYIYFGEDPWDVVEYSYYFLNSDLPTDLTVNAEFEGTWVAHGAPDITIDEDGVLTYGEDEVTVIYANEEDGYGYTYYFVTEDGEILCLDINVYEGEVIMFNVYDIGNTFSVEYVPEGELENPLEVLVGTWNAVVEAGTHGAYELVITADSVAVTLDEEPVTASYTIGLQGVVIITFDGMSYEVELVTEYLLALKGSDDNVSYYLSSELPELAIGEEFVGEWYADELHYHIVVDADGSASYGPDFGIVVGADSDDYSSTYRVLFGTMLVTLCANGVGTEWESYSMYIGDDYYELNKYVRTPYEFDRELWDNTWDNGWSEYPLTIDDEGNVYFNYESVVVYEDGGWYSFTTSDGTYWTFYFVGEGYGEIYIYSDDDQNLTLTNPNFAEEVELPEELLNTSWTGEGNNEYATKTWGKTVTVEIDGDGVITVTIDGQSYTATLKKVTEYIDPDDAQWNNYSLIVLIDGDEAIWTFSSGFGGDSFISEDNGYFFAVTKTTGEGGGDDDVCECPDCTDCNCEGGCSDGECADCENCGGEEEPVEGEVTATLTADEDEVSENEDVTLTANVVYPNGDSKKDEDGEVYEVYVQTSGGSFENADENLYELEGNTFKALVAGTYKIVLNVTSTNGKTASAEVIITVAAVELDPEISSALTNGWVRVATDSDQEIEYTAGGYVGGYDVTVSNDAQAEDGTLTVNSTEPTTVIYTITFTHKTDSSKTYTLEVPVSFVTDVESAPVLGTDPFGGTYGELIPSTGLVLYFDVTNGGSQLSYDDIEYSVSDNTTSKEVKILYVGDSKDYPYVLVEDFGANTATGEVTVKLTAKNGENVAAATKVFTVTPIADANSAKINAYINEVLEGGRGDMDTDIIMSGTNRENCVVSKEGIFFHRTAGGWSPADMFCVSPDGADNFQVDFEWTVVKRAGDDNKASFVVNWRTNRWEGWCNDGKTAFYVEKEDVVATAGYWGENSDGVHWCEAENKPSAEVGKVIYVRFIHTVEDGTAKFEWLNSENGSDYRPWVSWEANVAAEDGKIGSPVYSMQFSHESGCFRLGNVKLTIND